MQIVLYITLIPGTSCRVVQIHTDIYQFQFANIQISKPFGLILWSTSVKRPHKKILVI